MAPVPPAMDVMSSTSSTGSSVLRRSLLLYVNGIRVEVPEKEIEPEMTLLQFLRTKLDLTGTKLGCGEGGCGACTVMVSKFDVSIKKVRHFSVNSCLAPVCAMDACAVTTVEGVGQVKGHGHDANGLHPVQKAIAESHGSQCGYCTPGFVMALYSMVKQKENGGKPLTMEDIEHGMDGNLCRCTGYRPILDAAKSFGDDAGEVKCKGTCENCPNKGNAATDIEDLDDGDSKPKKITSCSSKKIRSLAKQWQHLRTFQTKDFPVELETKTLSPDYLQLAGSNVQWFAPVTLNDLLKLKSKFNDAKISVGNTEMGIETKFKRMHYAHLINVNRVPELVSIEKVASTDPIQKTLPFEGLKVGAAVTLTDVKDYLSNLLHTLPEYQTRGFVSIIMMLKWFASNHIRNVACLAGNIVTASPISDMNPLLGAMNAYIELRSEGKPPRYTRVRDFFIAYRKVGLENDEVIIAVYLPYTKQHEYMLPFKQARRREDDISIVTAGVRVNLEAKNSQWIITDASFVYGGMAPVTKPAVNTEQFIIGKPFSAESFDVACDVLYEKDFNLPEGVPGGMAKYRESLCSSFLYKFFVATSETLAKEVSKNSLPQAPSIAPKEKSAADSFLFHHRPASEGIQHYSEEKGGLTNSKHRAVGGKDDDRKPIGLPVMHKSAYVQVTGDALYADDIPNTPGTLHAAFVLSTIPHGIIKKIDASEALALPGVEAFFDASVFTKEQLGSNKIGPVLKDEECFASEKVVCVGQPVGLVVATSHELATAAADKVKIEYEPLPSIITIQDAIKAQSFFGEPHIIDQGNVKKGFEESDVVVEGEVYLGGQEQFYFETNATLCTPHERGLNIISSTQAATKTQVQVSRVLGIDENRIVCTTKRIGGGFGGKETRSVFVSCGASVAAYVLNKPVKMLLERHIDMLTTGGRHPFYAKYKLGSKKDGQLVALEVEIYNNAGYSLDLSMAVLDRSLFHCENSYKIPNLRAVGRVCKTNLPTNTAFRGFGGPQGLIIAENYMEHLARTLKIPVEDLRFKNMYHHGDVTHFGQPLVDNFQLRSLWSNLMNQSQFEKKKQEVEAFNAQHRYKKKGVAMIPTKFGISFTAKFMNQGGALVHVYADGSVLISHGGVEMGQGLHTKVIQVAAKAFGIAHEKVHVNETSTDKVPNSQPSAASMSTDLYGMATLDACEQILARLEPFKKRMPNASFAEIAHTAYMERVNLSAQGFYIVPHDRCGYNWDLSVEENCKIGTAFNYFTTGVACTVVELDVLTGDFHMESVDILMDLGASINPTIDIGQIEGAFMQGFGLFALEELVWGDDSHPWVRRGELFTRGPGTYKIPSANDVPVKFQVWLQSEAKNPFAVHSSRAVGEPPLFLGSSAFFAVKEAIYAARKDAGIEGYFSLRSPLTPERARMACADELLNKVFKARGGDMKNYQPHGSF